MGLDLTLFSISNKANFVIDKAKLNVDYANDFDKIQDTELLRLHLKMVQTNSDENLEHVLLELIEDSKIVLSHYPNNKIQSYQFYSKTRGYETLNYLLAEYFKENGVNFIYEKIFYSGIEINEDQYSNLQYFDSFKTEEISNILQPINFSDIEKFYDYHKIEEMVYKATPPEKLEDLKAEYEDLKTFFKNSTEMKAFIVIKID